MPASNRAVGVSEGGHAGPSGRCLSNDAAVRKQAAQRAHFALTDATAAGCVLRRYVRNVAVDDLDRRRGPLLLLLVVFLPQAFVASYPTRHSSALAALRARMNLIMRSSSEPATVYLSSLLLMPLLLIWFVQYVFWPRREAHARARARGSAPRPSRSLISSPDFDAERQAPTCSLTHDAAAGHVLACFVSPAVTPLLEAR